VDLLSFEGNSLLRITFRALFFLFSLLLFLALPNLLLSVPPGFTLTASSESVIKATTGD